MDALDCKLQELLEQKSKTLTDSWHLKTLTLGKNEDRRRGQRMR